MARPACLKKSIVLIPLPSLIKKQQQKTVAFSSFLRHFERLLTFHLSVSDCDGNAPVTKERKKERKKRRVGWSFPQIDLPSAAQSLSQDSVHRLQHF